MECEMPIADRSIALSERFSSRLRRASSLHPLAQQASRGPGSTCATADTTKQVADS